ncbi:hypothetical protein Nepgr_025061 [Nepenthes gracilis]|uniref:Uncharacterized protein n=1 Tax=Nepenthes gracilis TaxID=150966 RepID=A0AAD3XZC6_NEPGR|nr:hypothetical protein Nepgr_025061 [Nepenthes gracilis]
MGACSKEWRSLGALLVASEDDSARLIRDMVGRLSPSESRLALEARYWDGIRLCRKIASLVAPHVPEGVFHPGNARIREASHLRNFHEEAAPSYLPD